ncbi:MAG: cysteine desulfurase [Candidatus Pacebacteria bacterium]|nr:cysteine desulfurase [Candidatus Paceibacterota bacterium]MCF7857285.1 cysteine desulfurase [Candidatus Paceibacterota bacterium]
MQFNFFKNKNQRIHLDYASTTPVHKEVFDEMRPYFSNLWANPSSIYKEGVQARKVIEESRIKLARTLAVRPSDITFTSGGTESNNLALIGIVESLHDDGRPYEDMEIISTKIEHPSIGKTLTFLEKKGVRIMYSSIDDEGRIDISELATIFNTKTVLVTFAYANSETGVVQDIKKITRAVRLWNEEHEAKILIHTDASQAPLWLPCELDMLGVDLMTLDAGKCYGPKGAGALVHRHWVKLNPNILGGGQEHGLRAGTENTAHIVGCVYAIVRAQEGYESRSLAVAKLRDEFFELLTSEIDGIVVNGSREFRIANNINISIPNVDTEYVVIWLDAKGVAAATRSACGSGKETGSHVVREMTNDEARATSTLRFTLGEESTVADVYCAVKILKDYLKCSKI